MARLIDADKIPYEECYVPEGDIQWGYKKALIAEKAVIDQIPTVDAVEVIRCKDCKFLHDKGYCALVTGLTRIEPDDFCSRGERRTDG